MIKIDRTLGLPEEADDIDEAVAQLNGMIPTSILPMGDSPSVRRRCQHLSWYDSVEDAETVAAYMRVHHKDIDWTVTDLRD